MSQRGKTSEIPTVKKSRFCPCSTTLVFRLIGTRAELRSAKMRGHKLGPGEFYRQTKKKSERVRERGRLTYVSNEKKLTKGISLFG